MSVFVHGEDLVFRFDTDQGEVSTICQVFIDGDTLELRDMAVYSSSGEVLQVGVRTLLGVARYVNEFAVEQGFRVLLLTAERRSGTTPGRQVFVRRRLR